MRGGVNEAEEYGLVLCRLEQAWHSRVHYSPGVLYHRMGENKVRNEMHRSNVSAGGSFRKAVNDHFDEHGLEAHNLAVALKNVYILPETD